MRLLLICLVLLLAQQSWASYDYEWEGSVSDNWETSSNWSDPPGSAISSNNNYGINGDDYLPGGNHPVIDGSTTYGYTISNVYLFKQAVLTMSNSTVTINNDMAIQSGADVIVGSALILNVDNIAVVDDGSTMTVNGGYINMSEDIIFSDNGPTESNTDGVNGSPIFTINSGTVDCDNIEFDDEVGDTNPQLVVTGGIITATGNIISTGNAIDITISGSDGSNDDGRLNVSGNVSGVLDAIDIDISGNGRMDIGTDLLGGTGTVDIDVVGNGQLNISGNLTGIAGTVNITASDNGAVDITGNIAGGVGTMNITISGNAAVNVNQNVTGTVNVIQNGANSSFTIGGNLTSNDVTMSDGDLDISGNWNNSGTVNVTGGTITFNGSSLQSISGSGLSFNDLVIDNSSGVQINNDISVGGTLTLTSGLLDMNNNTLSITNTSTSAISRSSGYVYSEGSTINWTVGTTGNYVYPFALDGSTPIFFDLDITTLSAGGTVSLSTLGVADGNALPYGIGNLNRRTSAPGVLPVVDEDNSENTVDRFWLINSTATITADITFRAVGSEVGSISGLQAQRWNGTSWEKPVDGQSSGGGGVTVSGVSSFSPWTMSGNDEPLPVEFLFFDAAKQGDIVKLDWATASEEDNWKFEIERSLDGIKFSKIGEVEGNGDSNQRIDYFFEDVNILSSLNSSLFYRLKQIDFDGGFEYSKTKLVSIEIERDKLQVLPNPYQSSFDLKFVSDQSGTAQIRLMSINGKVLFSREYNVLKGPNSITVSELKNLSSGVYIINVQGRANSYTERISKRD